MSLTDFDNLEMEDGVPEYIMSAAKNIDLDLLPEKSKVRYIQEYEKFTKWCTDKKISNISKEEVLLFYFQEISKNFQPSTMWSKYSMVKSMLKLKKNVDISRHFKLIAFLKKKMVGFRPKKSKALSHEDVGTFLSTAPDDIYLLIKVATIFGVAGACRREELTYLLCENVVEQKELFLVKIPDSKTHQSRSFVVTGEKNLNLIKKYISLRPKSTPHQRFFVNFQKGKCTNQTVGINKFGKMPSNVAAFLRLPNPETYTGHCYRRSSATMLADAGVDITNLKRLGGWQSTKVAESYVDESMGNKKRIANHILHSKEKNSPPPSPLPSTSFAYEINVPGSSGPDNPHQYDNLRKESVNIIANTKEANQQNAPNLVNNAYNCHFSVTYHVNFNKE